MQKLSKFLCHRSSLVHFVRTRDVNWSIARGEWCNPGGRWRRIGPLGRADFIGGWDYPAGVTTAGPEVDARSRRMIAGVLLAVALLIVAYWVAWLARRYLGGSATRAG